MFWFLVCPVLAASRSHKCDPVWQSPSQGHLSACTQTHSGFSASFYHPGKLAGCTRVMWKWHNSSDSRAGWLKTSALAANNLPRVLLTHLPGTAGGRSLNWLSCCHSLWQGHVRQLLLMVCAEMLQRALPCSHCSSVAADDIETWVTPPTDQCIQSPVSTEQVVLGTGASYAVISSSPLGRPWQQEKKHRQLAEESAL